MWNRNTHKAQRQTAVSVSNFEQEQGLAKRVHVCPTAPFMQRSVMVNAKSTKMRSQLGCSFSENAPGFIASMKWRPLPQHTRIRNRLRWRHNGRDHAVKSTSQHQYHQKGIPRLFFSPPMAARQAQQMLDHMQCASPFHGICMLNPLKNWKKFFFHFYFCSYKFTIMT